MCSLLLTQNVLTLRDEIKAMMNWHHSSNWEVQCSFAPFLGRVLHNRLSRSGAWGAIITVNGSSTRSGFRDKSGFSHQLYSPFRHLCPVGFIRNPLNRRRMWVAQRQRGGGAMLTVTWWYVRKKSCITPLKSDKRTQAVKAFSVKCLVFISLYRLLLRHKGLLLSMNVVTAWMTLQEQSGHPGHDCTDVEGWRRGRKLWDYTQENTLWISGRMVNVVPSFAHSVNILPGCICVSVGALGECPLAHYASFMLNKKCKGGEQWCVLHAITTSSLVSKHQR